LIIHTIAMPILKRFSAANGNDTRFHLEMYWERKSCTCGGAQGGGLVEFANKRLLNS